jgi:hypothetical protein
MYHTHLMGQVFELGQVLYVVTHNQEYGDRVRCYREEDNVVTAVCLPLVFVLEQLADEVAMEPALVR